MPRKQVGEHSQNWELATRDEILFPKLSRKHKKMAKLIARAYDSIDAIYEHVAKILDENGIFGSYRLAYKAYSQELWRICQTYSGKARELEAEAIAVKYWLYGCDDKILYEIGKLFGLEVFWLFKPILLAEVKNKFVPSGSKIFDSDLTIRDNGFVILQIETDTSMYPIFVRGDGQESALNEKNNLVPDSLYEFWTTVVKGDVINYKVSADCKVTARLYWTRSI